MSLTLMPIMNCHQCGVDPGTLYYAGGSWYCRLCFEIPGEVVPYFKEPGNNIYNPKATKAHLKDVEDRRWHPTEKRQFYYSKEKPKTYFFPKG